MTFAKYYGKNNIFWTGLQNTTVLPWYHVQKHVKYLHIKYHINNMVLEFFRVLKKIYNIII